MDNTSTIFDESKWLSFKKNLKKNVGDSAFNNWLKHLNYVSVEETTITLFFFFLCSMIISLTFLIFSIVPTDVPPNFNTTIFMINIFN